MEAKASTKLTMFRNFTPKEHNRAMETRNHLKKRSEFEKSMSRVDVFRDRFLILTTILCLTTFISCQKERFSGRDIEDIAQIKELLKDIDCEKGLHVESKKGGYFNLQYLEKAIRTYDVYYCGQITTNVDVLYKEMGDVKSATYHKQDNRVIIKSTTKEDQGGYIGIAKVKWERTFFTKNKW